MTTNFINSGVEFNCIFANNGPDGAGLLSARWSRPAWRTSRSSSTGGSPDAYAFLEDGVEAANMTAPVSIQGVQTYKNMF